MGQRRATYKGKRKADEWQFAYATHKIVDSNVYPAEVRNTLDNSVIDVGYDGSVIDVDAITSFASGNECTYSKLYDQQGRLSALDRDLSYQPIATDASFEGVEYLRDTSQEAGLALSDNVNVDFSQDVIMHYIFRNEINGNTQRMNVCVFTGKNGGGVFVLGIRRSSSNYIIGFTLQAGLAYTSQSSQRRAVIDRGNTTTTFTLYTFSKISGVYAFHRNGVSQVLDTTIENIGNPNNNILPETQYGISIGCGSSNLLITENTGKINDFKGALMKSGDFSSFDLSAHISEVMTKFGI